MNIRRSMDWPVVGLLVLSCMISTCGLFYGVRLARLVWNAFINLNY